MDLSKPIAMDEDRIKKDFDRELSINQFPFHGIVMGNPDYVEDLYNEFSKLSTKPKFHFYFNEFISDEQWDKDRSENRGYTHVSNSSRNVAANFIQTSELENKANQLHLEFQQMITKDAVEDKYKGRYIKDMQTFQLLQKIEKELDYFRKYVLQDGNVSNYSTYARPAAKRIVTLVNKLPIEQLKKDLLDFIIGMDIENDFKLMLWFSSKKDNDGQLASNFNYLKTHADEIFNEELEKLKDKSTQSIFSKQSRSKAFVDSRYGSMGFDELIAEGEGKFIEFKRTLAVSLETGRPDSKPKHAIAKTLAAFFNSGGGALLIGVDDQKNITGLDPDFNFYKGGENRDNFKKSFDDLVSTKFGSDFHGLIGLDFYCQNGKELCLIVVEIGNSEPVYIKDELNKNQEFYIRRQASTVALKVNEVTTYIKSHW